MADTEYDLDLFYHAMNYRGATTQHAELFWKELQACVDRLLAAERERCAKVCEAKDEFCANTINNGAGVGCLICADAIRALES